MKLKIVISKLIVIDNLEDWSKVLSGLEKRDKASVISAAKPLWLKRMVVEDKILFHPDVLEKLLNSEWQTTEIHDQMIWANLLVTSDETDSKEKFNRAKSKLIKKYGRDWWENVYRRIKSTYAARQSILNQGLSLNTPTHFLATNTIVLGHYFNEQRNKALKMLSKE